MGARRVECQLRYTASRGGLPLRLHVRVFLSGVLIAVLCIPGDCKAQAAQPQSSAATHATVSTLLVAAAVEPAPSTPHAQDAQSTPQQAPAAQNGPQQKPPGQNGMSGIAGGLGAAAVYDEQKRPITAGGFVDSGPVIFED